MAVQVIPLKHRVDHDNQGKFRFFTMVYKIFMTCSPPRPPVIYRVLSLPTLLLHPHWLHGCFLNAKILFFLRNFTVAVPPCWNTVAPKIRITLDFILVFGQMSPSPEAFSWLFLFLLKTNHAALPFPSLPYFAS